MTIHLQAMRLLGAVALLGLVACDDSIKVGDIPSGSETGPLTVDVGGDATRDGGNDDAVPDTVDGVWLRFDAVSVHHAEEGWVIIDDGRLDVDLMAEREGSTVEIGGGDVYIGDYDILRLSITDSWIVVDGAELELAISSGVDIDDGLDLTTPISVDQSTRTAVWVGWDLDNQLTVDSDVWTLGTDVNFTVDVDDQ